MLNTSAGIKCICFDHIRFVQRYYHENLAKWKYLLWHTQIGREKINNKERMDPAVK